MTGRDLAWRVAGVAVAGTAAAGGLTAREGSPLVIVYFVAAIVGIVLMLHGKRVAVAWRAERHGHRDTAAAIHSRRVERHRRTLASPRR